MVDKPSCIACDESISSPGEKINFCHWFWPFFVNLIFGNFCHFWPILTHPLTPTIFFYGRKALFRSAVKNLCPYQVKKIMFLHYFSPFLIISFLIVFGHFWSFSAPPDPYYLVFHFFMVDHPFLDPMWWIYVRTQEEIYFLILFLAHLFENLIFGHFWSFSALSAPDFPFFCFFLL